MSTAPNRTGLFAATTAILLVTTLLFAWMAFKPNSAPIKTTTVKRAAQTSQEDAARAVATRFGSNLVNFSHSSVDNDLRELQGDTTSRFSTTDQQALPGGSLSQFKQTIVSRASTSKGDVKGTAVTSLDSDSATVLVIVVQTVHSKTTNETNKFHILELTLVNDNGWKVDQVGTPAT